MSRLFHCCLFFCLLLAPALAAAKPLSVFVSIPPQADFVERIGGSKVKVEILVEPGQSPATYALTPKRMAALAAADVYFRIGVPFENVLLPKLAAAVPDLPVIDTGEEIALMDEIGGETEGETEGEQGQEDDHGHGDVDPHTWMDPMLVKTQAEAITAGLGRLSPGDETFFRANLERFSADLDALDAGISARLKPFAGRILYVFHPAYAYFCVAYGLEQQAVASGGGHPSGRELGRLIEEAKKSGARAIFVQPQFSSKSAVTLAEAIGGKVVILDPLARDYLINMEKIATDIAAGLGGGK